MSVLKVGLIGCGRVTAARHLPALQRLPNVKVVALADNDLVRLRQVAGQFHIRHCYTDVHALLENSAVDIVGVCVPANFHVEVALAAIAAGKHVFIEKPLTLTLEDADRLITCSQHVSSKIMVGFNFRWHRLIRKARKLLQREAVGEVETIRTILVSYHEAPPEWRKQRTLGGGAFFEQAVHLFDLWRFLLQSEVEEVFATSRSGPWDDETIAVSARLTNGVLATALCSERTGENNEVEVYGRLGRFRVSCYRFDGLEYDSQTSVPGNGRARVREFLQTIKELPRGLLQMRRGGDFLASYDAEWNHFLNAIRHDTPVECTLEDGRRALQIVLAAIGSATLGRPVPIT